MIIKKKPSKIITYVLTPTFSTLLAASCAAGETTKNLDLNSKKIISTDIAVFEKPIPAISTDQFGDFSTLRGNGSGDLVLVIYDPSGTSPRKKSLMVDLSITEEDGRINDLTVNDIIVAKNYFQIFNAELNDLIKSSHDTTQIEWHIFGITNHTKQTDRAWIQADVNLGLVSTEKEPTKKAMTFKQIHMSRVLRAESIIQNNLYGIQSNSSLLSYAGEKSAFIPKLHRTLANGSKSTGSINDTLILGLHRTINTATASPSYDYKALGSVKLSPSINGVDWQLTFTPHQKP